MKTLLNDNWLFLKLPYGSNYDDARRSESWRPVDLPHDWLIWQHRDLYETADAWYKRDLYIEKAANCYLLFFDGVYMDCDILLEGRCICSHAYGYTSFYADLTDKLHAGNNEIMVHIRHRSPNTRWYSGSGIFRDVFLYELPENHVIPDSFYFSETAVKDGWLLKVSAETSEQESSPFFCEITDSSDNVLAGGQTESRDGKISLSLQIREAEAWDPEHPVLYRFRYSFGGTSGERMLGFRTVSFSPEHGLILNGRPFKLRGVCLHHDLGALGAAFHEKAAKRQLQLMKDMGANALRTSHNPPASRLLDLCDEMGILVIDEAFDMWERPKTEFDYARFFGSCEEKDVALWVRRDRCHPCVIMWSIGNEIYDMHADLRGTEVCRMLMEQVRSHDPEQHAAVTFGCNYMPWEGGQRCADIVKIVGYNYGEKLYEQHHRDHPDWVIYGSETASVLSSRGVYHFPIEKSIMSEADLQCSALGNSNTSWGADDLRAMITEDLKCDFSMGQFIWSGIDYIGEPTPYHTRSCYFGQADTACFPKDPYYLFQSLWTSKPVLHIGVSWDWNPGQMIDVPVMTNHNRVELLLNGRSLGIRDVNPREADQCMPVWKIPFEPGELCARALDQDSRILQEDHRYTSGDTQQLIMTSEDSVLLSDGHDIAFITVQAADLNGHPVENARDRVRIDVSGGAYLLGTDNGDSTDPDGYKQSCRRLFNGKLLVIIASNGHKEDALISITSSGGISASHVIRSERADLIRGNSCVMRIDDQVKQTGMIPVRKIEITAEESRHLTKERNTCLFRWKILPSGAAHTPVLWQITNDAGIESPFAVCSADDETVTATVNGDGKYYLRGLTGNTEDHPEIISQIEFSAEGIGNPALDPYEFVSAGLYDIHDGEIGTGNEKGIAFSRDAASMAGFSRIDFGSTGSDTMILPVFALDGKPYEMELFDGDPRSGGKLISLLHYEKPSIWNVYQEAVYKLPVRLKGVHCLCFRMKQKVHLKGFRFEKQSRAFLTQLPGDADAVYGDSFVREGNTIHHIGNNVSLIFHEMDFGDRQDCRLMIRGKTDLPLNSITVRIRDVHGETRNEVVDFRGGAGEEQSFAIRVPGGICTVTFVFLPGSSFDFDAFRFE